MGTVLQWDSATVGQYTKVHGTVLQWDSATVMGTVLQWDSATVGQCYSRTVY